MLICIGYESYHVAAECGYHGIEGFRFSYWFFFQGGRSKVNEIMSSNCNLYENWQDAARTLFERKEKIKPKLLIVSPSIRKRAKELAEKLGIETRGNIVET